MYLNVSGQLKCNYWSLLWHTETSKSLGSVIAYLQCQNTTNNQVCRVQKKKHEKKNLISISMSVLVLKQTIAVIYQARWFRLHYCQPTRAPHPQDLTPLCTAVSLMAPHFMDSLLKLILMQSQEVISGGRGVQSDRGSCHPPWKSKVSAWAPSFPSKINRSWGHSVLFRTCSASFQIDLESPKCPLTSRKSTGTGLKTAACLTPMGAFCLY